MFDKKILCIGNETTATHDLVSELAVQNDTENHGLIKDPLFLPQYAGYYHTSIVDVPAGDILQNLSKKFNVIMMLDQSVDEYPHWKSFVNTFRLMINLEKQDCNTCFRNNTHNKDILYWYDVLHTSKSFCLIPFMTLSNDYGYATLCFKNPLPVTKIKDITDWSTDPAFAPIRHNLVAGIPMPDKCNTCYEREQEGGESTRQFESLEWAIKLKLKDVQDANQIKDPVVYDIRPSNKCNIMCRMCDDKHSHLIEQEYKKVGWQITTDKWKFQPFPYEKINYDTAERIYWAGGEPTVMPEFYAFLRDCIKNNTVDFDLNIGTNGQKISDRLWNLLKEFPRVTFNISIDGYKKINDYIRWLSDFETVRTNCFKIQDQGHILSFQTVFSMWNATRIHEIFEFYDRDFPGCNTLVQPSGGVADLKSPWNNPLREQVLESMHRCKQTKVCYNNGRNTEHLVDEMINRYSNYDYDPNVLAKFFEYNDTLDRARNSRLVDYIPELEHTRMLLLK
jgi:pyruvate-formate lyase-activating enzyme